MKVCEKSLMKVRIGGECKGCGLCSKKAPNIIRTGIGGKAEAITVEVPPDFEKAVRQAAIECPAGAIILE